MCSYSHEIERNKTIIYVVLLFIFYLYILKYESPQNLVECAHINKSRKKLALSFYVDCYQVTATPASRVLNE